VWIALLSVLAFAAVAQCSIYLNLLNTTLLQKYDTCIADGNENYVVYYTLRDTEVDFAIVAATAGWVGLGVGGATVGVEALYGDPIVGFVKDGSFSIHDFYIESQQPCNEDAKTGVCIDSIFGGVDNVFDRAGWESNGVTTLQFSRPLAASDPTYDLPIQNGTRAYIIAFGQSDDVTTPHNAGRFVGRWNLYAPDLLPGRCKGRCGGNRGTCQKGCCVCQPGYTGVDCSIFADGGSSSYVDDGTSGGPSKGKIAGIIIGVLLALCFVVGIVAWVRKKLQKRQRKQRGIRLPD